MAEPILIDLSNYDTMLKESSAGRAGSPDGNIFFDVTNGRVELITLEELATVDLGSGAEANPLTNQTGIFIGALYAFERLCRRTNETLRKYDFFAKGTFKYAGAYEIVNSRKFDILTSSVGDDREKLRGSGWIERALDGNVDRIYFGARSLGNIESTSQPYYQLEALTGEPFDFEKLGPIDEAIQVLGKSNNEPPDEGAGDFSKLTYLSNKVRTYGMNYDEKILADSGISEMSGYSAGFALGESPHLTTGNYPLANVYGGAKIEPWISMHLDKLVSPRNEVGFKEGDGDFTWVLSNDATVPGTLDQCVAFLDALAQVDEDINTSTPPITKGKRVSTWYTYNAAGQIVTRSGAADGKGLFIENIPTADQQRIIFTSDEIVEGENTTRSYPYKIAFNIIVGVNAKDDPNGWFHVWKALHYGESGAETVLDADDEEMKGSTYGFSTIALEYDSEDGEVEIVVECEGDGKATQAKTEATIKVGAADAVQTVVCSPGLETNM